MIYVTGDIHGDYSRFKAKEIRKLKKNDTLLVCGDFGFIWDGSKKEQQLLEKLGRKKYNILFVEGENDNLDLLYNYPESEWCGGTVRVISKRLMQLCRGSIFDIEGESIFAFGGGHAVLDKETDYTKPWQEKISVTEDEIKTAVNNLAAVNNKVDYIVSYQSSGKNKDMLTMKDNEPSVLDLFLDKVRTEIEYKMWFFGGFHINKIIPPKEFAIFDRIVNVSEDFNNIILSRMKTGNK